MGHLEGRRGRRPAGLTTVALAYRDAERLAFAYTAAGGECSQRSVDPFRLVSLGRRWYLVGYDLDRGDWRSFRLDRLTGPRGTGVRFGPRRFPAADAATFVRDRIADLPARYAVEAVVAAPADGVRARIGRWATVEDDGLRRCRVRIDADNLDWPATGLGMAGADCTVVDPPELRDHLRALARRSPKQPKRGRKRARTRARKRGRNCRTPPVTSGPSPTTGECRATTSRLPERPPGAGTWLRFAGADQRLRRSS